MNKSQALEFQKQNEEIVQLNDKLASLSNKETLKSNMLLKEEMIVHLNGLVSEKQKDSSQSEEMTDIVEALQTQLFALELEIAEKAPTILDLNHTVDDLEAKLFLVNEDMAKLEEEKSQMQLDLLGVSE